jgi:ATP-dependent helicase YprA (DUF1998 family)
MATIESLRNEYKELTGRERAVMTAEAIARRDEESVEALTAPDVFKAYQSLCHEWFFITAGTIALVNSMKAGSAVTTNALLEQMCEADERELGKAVESVQEKILSLEDRKELVRQRRAWLLALQALDGEARTACIASLKHIAGDYVERVLSEDGEPIDYSSELEHLRACWKAFEGGEDQPLQ